MPSAASSSIKNACSYLQPPGALNTGALTHLHILCLFKTCNPTPTLCVMRGAVAPRSILHHHRPPPMPQQTSALFANERLEKTARQRCEAQGQLGQPDAASGCRWSHCSMPGVIYLKCIIGTPWLCVAGAARTPINGSRERSLARSRDIEMVACTGWKTCTNQDLT